jgi:hypothetical protein
MAKNKHNISRVSNNEKNPFVPDSAINPQVATQEVYNSISNPSDAPAIPEWVKKAYTEEVDPVKKAMSELETARLEKAEQVSRANVASLQLKKAEDDAFNKKKEDGLLIPVKQVPSLGKIYPDGYEIYYSRHNTRDFEDLNNSDLRRYDQYKILLEGIICRGIKNTDLTFHDFNFISVLRRLESQGAVKFRHPYQCTTCMRRGVHEFTLSDVEFTPLEVNLPIIVRFHSFPEEIFKFVPYTIGDILRLIENKRYYRIRAGKNFIYTENGDKVIDSIAIFACSCISHQWQDAYDKLMKCGVDPRDREIILSIDRKLLHDIAPITFSCRIPFDLAEANKMKNEAEELVRGVVTGELSTTSPQIDYPEEFAEEQPDLDEEQEDDVEDNDEQESTQKNNTGTVKEVPLWLQNIEKQKYVCGAENKIDVSGRDIIIPFRESDDDTEYGILSC